MCIVIMSDSLYKSMWSRLGAEQTRPHLRLIINSDLHFTEAGIRPDKSGHAALAREVVSKTPIDAIICAGDLTDMGWDGRRFLCWAYGGAEDQVTPLRRWVEGLEADVAPVFLASGNHDQYVPWPYRHKGVRDFIESRHGGLHYNWEIIVRLAGSDSEADGNADDGQNEIRYRGVCLDVYPDKAGRDYLANIIQRHPNDRYIIYFHYNLEGSYSDWWSEDEKQKFADVIAGHDIALIVCGHYHINSLKKWRGYNVAMGAGSRLAVVTLGPGIPTITEY